MDPESAQGLWASLPWTVLAIALIALVGVAVIWVLVSRLREFQQRLDPLDRLTDLELSVQKLSEAHAALDLRRLEHVLIDIRDGQRRVEDGLLRAVEAAKTAQERPVNGTPTEEPRPIDLAERVINRLLALNYERIQLVTPVDALGDMLEGDGEISVEARRNGANCKGRVIVRGGAITDVMLKPVYSIFP